MKTILITFVLSSSLGYATHASAADAATTLTIDNDLLTGSDNNYTNGLGISWVSNDLETYEDGSFLSKWGEFWSFLPSVGDEGWTTYATWSVGQEMYTSDDIKNPNPPEDDQPYAGILYVDNVLYARKERWAQAWELKLGVVGPASHADDVQKNFHELIDADKPLGWHTQLPNEPIVNVTYLTAHLLAEGNAGASAKWRVVPVGSVGLGTYFTGASLGLYGEFGWNLVDAFGGTALREGLNAASTVGVGPVEGWSVAFFGGFGGYAVAHYLPLDGTVFKDSRSVDSEPFIGMGSVGVSVRHSRLVLALGVTHFTKTFETERQNAEFATLSLSGFF